ncbi:MAG: TatD family hydrolase [Candidatus Brocadiia bacterium]
MIDTHAHLDFPDYKDDLSAVIERAQGNGVSHIITVGTDMASSKRAIDIASRYSNVYASVGIHPSNSKDVKPEDWKEFEKLISEKKVVAIGETGLDFHKDYAPKDAQEKVFIKQLELASEYELPVIVHSREAHPECLKTLKQVMGNEVIGVAHCFSGTAEVAEEYLKLGMSISIGGPITFPKSEQLKKVAKKITVENLLLETDCPFLAPQSKRGQRNEPAYLTYCIEELSKIYGLSIADIDRVTSHNAKKLFGFEQLVKEGEVAYSIRNSLYLNITNRCTAQCYFCVTKFTDYVKGHNLRLKIEPSLEEVIKAIPDNVSKKYKEVVFCGYGEPTLRLDVIKGVAKHLKNKGMNIRLNTNGHGNLIHKRSIAVELKGLIDVVSVSLNATDPKEYVKTCNPQFGEITLSKVLEFINDAKNNLPYVEITTVIRPGIEADRFRDFAKELGVDFRARIYNEVG